MCLDIRPSCYQFQGVVKGGSREDDNLGKIINWDHHKIDPNITSSNQKMRGDRSQFKGLRCGIEIHLNK